MSEIYITGHKNPDMDSLCSAVAYSRLKNRIDPDNTYIPIRCGVIAGNTKAMVESQGIEVPQLVQDVIPKIRDVIFTSDDRIDANAGLNELTTTFDEHDPPVKQVFDGDEFYGLISVDEIACWLTNTIKGKDSLTHFPKVREVMKRQYEKVQADEHISDSRSRFNMSDIRGLALFEKDKYVGFVTRRCFLDVPKKKVILVDHNEPKQSIRGIEQAEIVEIIDHHRIDAVKTQQPIFIDAEPVGSTCTIVHQLFMRNGLMPDKDTAKILLTGILADTLVLRSPTTTSVDVLAANTLSIICGVELETFGISIFSNVEGLKNGDPVDNISSDFKTYNENGIRFGIGQSEVTTLSDIDDYKDAYLKALEEVKTRNGLDWAAFMITDIINEQSILLTTEHKANKLLPFEQIDDGMFDMPGVMSRKKQLLPDILFVVNM